jgi:hypothetical protein
MSLVQRRHILRVVHSAKSCRVVYCRMEELRHVGILSLGELSLVLLLLKVLVQSGFDWGLVGLGFQIQMYRVPSM